MRQANLGPSKAIFTKLAETNGQERSEGFAIELDIAGFRSRP